MKRGLTLLAIGGAVVFGAQSAHADAHIGADDLPFECAIADSSAVIHLALCPNVMSEENLREVAQQVCGDNPACGVWVWADASSMPAQAPENHDGLTQDQITSAVAVWDNDGGQLILINRE